MPTYQNDIGRSDDDRIEVLYDRAVGRRAYRLGQKERAGDGNKQGRYEHKNDIAEMRERRPPEEMGQLQHAG